MYILSTCTGLNSNWLNHGFKVKEKILIYQVLTLNLKLKKYPLQLSVIIGSTLHYHIIKGLPFTWASFIHVYIIWLGTVSNLLKLYTLAVYTSIMYRNAFQLYTIKCWNATFHFYIVKHQFVAFYYTSKHSAK